MIQANDLVIYDTGYKKEFGKVKRVSDDGSHAFVWYHTGDTAASTKMEHLTVVGSESVDYWRSEVENAYAIEEIMKKGER